MEVRHSLIMEMLWRCYSGNGMEVSIKIKDMIVEELLSWISVGFLTG